MTRLGASWICWSPPDFRTDLHDPVVVLPTAAWYEKHDISSTDMHPFLHSRQLTRRGRQDRPRTFKALAFGFSRLAESLGV